MTRFLFDVKLFASVTVEAESEAEARKMLAEVMDCAGVNAGAWPNGDPVVFEASQDGEPDLVEVEEIDGSAEIIAARLA
jgi:hypothetical protein